MTEQGVTIIPSWHDLNTQREWDEANLGRYAGVALLICLVVWAVVGWQHWRKG